MKKQINKQNNVGDIIHQFRKKNNTTQLELSQKITYSKKLISDWECGRRTPTLKGFLELENIFGIRFFIAIKKQFRKHKICEKNKKTSA